MVAIAREQENQSDMLNWFVSIGGVLTDAYSVEYRVYDISGGLPGTQVFPVTEGEYETVTTGTGHFSTGSYYAYDNTAVAGWTPTVTQTIGTHRIEWRWKALASSPYQCGVEDFEVLASSVGSTGDSYVSVSEIRSEGILEADYSDDTVLATIELWQAMIERITRQWFNIRTLVLSVDGTDSDTLHFGVPIIEIEYVRLNNSTTNLDTDYYKVYNGITYPDDRRNPRIKLCSLSEYSDIYTAPISSGRMLFRKGRQNQEIKGTFGFVESDGLTPKPIKRALTKLVIEKLVNSAYTAPNTPHSFMPPILGGTMIVEKTDGHERQYSDHRKMAYRRPIGFDGISFDPEILNILQHYRAPLGIATPAHPSIQ
jgi:hypothetical protein